MLKQRRTGLSTISVVPQSIPRPVKAGKYVDTLRLLDLSGAGPNVTAVQK